MILYLIIDKYQLVHLRLSEGSCLQNLFYMFSAKSFIVWTEKKRVSKFSVNAIVFSFDMPSQCLNIIRNRNSWPCCLSLKSCLIFCISNQIYFFLGKATILFITVNFESWGCLFHRRTKVAECCFRTAIALVTF